MVLFPLFENFSFDFAESFVFEGGLEVYNFIEALVELGSILDPVFL